MMNRFCCDQEVAEGRRAGHRWASAEVGRVVHHKVVSSLHIGEVIIARAIRALSFWASSLVGCEQAMPHTKEVTQLTETRN